MSYLGIDYGSRHLGLSLADGSLAAPLTTLPTRQFLSALPALIHQHQVQALVIGSAPAAFLHQLSVFNLPIHQIDETLTSQDATRLLFHTSPHRRQRLQHAAAATLILQSWLDSSLSRLT